MLKALGWVGAQEEKVEWWTDKGFIGTKDWNLIYDDEWGAPYVYLRMLAALMGSLLIPTVYLSARALGLGRLPAAVAATLTLTETVSALQVRRGGGGSRAASLRPRRRRRPTRALLPPPLPLRRPASSSATPSSTSSTPRRSARPLSRSASRSRQPRAGCGWR